MYSESFIRAEGLIPRHFASGLLITSSRGSSGSKPDVSAMYYRLLNKKGLSKKLLPTAVRTAFFCERFDFRFF